jgi:hypothetical protein
VSERRPVLLMASATGSIRTAVRLRTAQANGRQSLA